jgi:hypothetical protein
MGKKQAEEAIKNATKSESTAEPKLTKSGCNFEVKRVHYSSMF